MLDEAREHMCSLSDRRLFASFALSAYQLKYQSDIFVEAVRLTALMQITPRKKGFVIKNCIPDEINGCNGSARCLTLHNQRVLQWLLWWLKYKKDPKRCDSLRTLRLSVCKGKMFQRILTLLIYISELFFRNVYKYYDKPFSLGLK